MPSSDARRRLVQFASVLTVAGGSTLVVALAALAADPTASPAGGDPRSPGEGPGLVGDPLFAIGLVLAIGLVALAATLAWVRHTGGRTN